MLLTKKDKDFIKKEYSGLTIYGDNLLKGVINFSASYNNLKKIFVLNEKGKNFLKGKYEIKIKFHKDNFPEVFEINLDLERGLDFHIYGDGKFCLTHTLYENKYKNKDFQFILEELIIPFLYNQTYYINNGKFLWEYGHGIEGTFEYIFDNDIGKKEYLWTLKNIKDYIKNNSKLFLYSENERKRLIKALGLKSKKSKKGFIKFIDFIKRNTNLFTKI